MTNQERFNEIFQDKIKRPGSEELLAFLNGPHSDFFTAPASTRFHGNYEGGLVEHSLHVYECLTDYLARERVKQIYDMHYSEDTIATVALLHDICKINCYTVGKRNRKINGSWQEVPFYQFNDEMPYGHGEKSVYMITPFMKLSREEAFAIRYHMGFSNDDPKNNVGYAFEHFPLAFALSTADMEATYFLDEVRSYE
ncbi:HD domain-containing protein [Catenisphaera adipataccumulans]|jgi:hypothetical protein|uniref:HD domain-containing protein n=1 Tax=Catenisphaera adipataccumulans TaxID=700500 RepID=A0A7W8FX37_9FIRM|nr:HD domain-containing protein [Catenisphaera adipataccumulans]MBB5183295.1 hypothetical protein [Catenisphaera adipataccumulans]